MNAARLLAHLGRVSEAPDAVPRLRRFILDLAVRGKLVEQDPSDEPASELLKRIQAEKARLVKAGEIKNERWMDTPANDGPRRPWGDIKNGYSHFADGDVGLAKITPCFENGKSTVFRGLTGGLGAGITELHVLRPVLIDAEYVLVFLKCPGFIEAGVPKMTGRAGQKRVPVEYFAGCRFPLPPLAEQQRIVAKVDELMALCDRLAAAQAERESRRDRLLVASLRRLS
jgi:type I restriction enzyme S subunit